MKLSEMNIERAYDCIGECLIPIGNICNDPEAVEGLKKLSTLEGLAPITKVGVMAKECPTLLKNHKDDIFTILSSVKGEDKKAYMKRTNIAMLVHDIVEMVNDEDLQMLFSTAQNSETDEFSGSVQVNTKEEA